MNTDTIPTTLRQGDEIGKYIQKLKQELPPFFTRKTVSEHLGGLLSSKTLANYDALDEGPTPRFTLGNKIGYERDSFLQWFEGKLQNR